MNADLELSIKTLPESCGVYQFFDKEGKTMYVGKAKNLKKRVSSYFQKTHHEGKTKVLVSKINQLKIIVVNAEYDALLLENNLIKKHRPRYNVMLRDDKTYPWICIKNERFPRIFLTRKLVKDGSEYFGPYASVRAVCTLLDFITETYYIRTCKDRLTQKKIDAKKFKVCLEYHIGNCLGPCENKYDEESYNKQIEEIKQLINGDFQPVIRSQTERMSELSQELKFEQAQKIKEQIKNLKKYREKSMIVNQKIDYVDVFSIVSDQDFAYVNYLKIAKGSIVQSLNTEIKKKLDESDKTLLTLAIVDIRKQWESNSKEVYTPFELSIAIPNAKFHVPKIGDKKKILDISLRNAQHFRMERYKKIKITDPYKHTNRILANMKKDLRLNQEPNHIECFDNSNIQGTNPVAACVVFRQAKPSKKEYRKFKIKTVQGANDFESMYEVITRRYSRLIQEKQPLPQLIVVDGGKGQLSSGYKALKKLGLEKKIAIIGIAKRLEELFFPNDSIPLYLDKKSETLKVIQQLRNEAHRFGITFHRNLRSKQGLKSELELIPGIGEQSITCLLRKFKSVKRIKQAPFSEIEKVIGKAKAGLIINYTPSSMKPEF